MDLSIYLRMINIILTPLRVLDGNGTIIVLFDDKHSDTWINTPCVDWYETKAATVWETTGRVWLLGSSEWNIVQKFGKITYWEIYEVKVSKKLGLALKGVQSLQE